MTCAYTTDVTNDDMSHSLSIYAPGTILKEVKTDYLIPRAVFIILVDKQRNRDVASTHIPPRVRHSAEEPGNRSRQADGRGQSSPTLGCMAGPGKASGFEKTLCILSLPPCPQPPFPPHLRWSLNLATMSSHFYFHIHSTYIDIYSAF